MANQLCMNMIKQFQKANSFFKKTLIVRLLYIYLFSGSQVLLGSSIYNTPIKEHCEYARDQSANIKKKHAALATVIMDGNIEGVRKILSEKPALNLADLHCGLERTHSILDDCADLGLVDLAALKPKPEILQLLLDQGANPNGCGFDVDEPLFNALHNRDLTATRLLLDNGANPNIRVTMYLLHKETFTPLHLLSSSLELYYEPDSWASQAMTLLINKGADIEALDEQKRTPLSVAFSHNHIAPAIILLSHGAQYNHRDLKGRHFLHQLAFNKNENFWILIKGYMEAKGEQVIRMASELPEIKDRLIRLRQHITQRQTESLPLYPALSPLTTKPSEQWQDPRVRERHWVYEFLSILDDAKWRVDLSTNELSGHDSDLANMPDNKGDLALHATVKAVAILGIDTCVNLALKYFPPADINALDAEGYSALHLAAKCSDCMTGIKELIRHGADPNRQTQSGQSAYDLGVPWYLGSENNHLQVLCRSAPDDHSPTVEEKIQAIIRSEKLAPRLKFISGDEQAEMLSYLVHTEDLNSLERFTRLFPVDQFRAKFSEFYFPDFSLNLYSSSENTGVIKELLNWRLPVLTQEYNALSHRYHPDFGRSVTHPVVLAVLRHNPDLLLFYSRNIDLFQTAVHNLLSAAADSEDPKFLVYLLNHSIRYSFSLNECHYHEAAKGHVFCTDLLDLIERGGLHQDILPLLNLFGRGTKNRSKGQLGIDFELNMAVKGGDTKRVSELLAQGANPNASIFTAHQLERMKQVLGLESLPEDAHWNSSYLLTTALEQERNQANAEMSRLLILYGATLYPMFHTNYSLFPTFPACGDKLPAKCIRSIQDKELVRLAKLIDPQERIVNNWNTGPEKEPIQQEINALSQLIARQLNITLEQEARSSVCLCLAIKPDSDNDEQKPYCQTVAETLTDETRELLCSESAF